MKLLLTSAGLTNKSIANTVIDLVGKPANEISVVFIPTAANPVSGDKSWLDENINEFKKQNYKSLDILDIATASEEIWRPQLKRADLICFGGGNEQYLAKIMVQSGVANAIPQICEKSVYMGISAGSMVAGQFLSSELMKIIYPEEIFPELSPSLGYVDCLFIPHLNSDYFNQVRKEVLEKYKKDFTFPLYACDDNSALKIVDGKVEIVSEGEYLILNEK